MFVMTGDTAADHSIENKEMMVIWAFGQVYPEYNHFLLPLDEFSVAQNERFFPVDQLKYHGSKNRGTTALNFFDEDNCKLQRTLQWTN